MSGLPEYLSYSSISTYLNCGEAWRRKYIAKEKSRSTPALVFGSAFHGTIERHLEQRDRALVDLWPEIWREKVEKEPDCDWGADTPEQHHNEGIRILSAPDVVQMVNRLTPHYDDQGIYMERRVQLTVPGVPVPIIGYIDLMTADGIPGDFKTASMRWTQDKAREELQPAFYLAALNQAGHTVPGLRFRHYVVTKGKSITATVLETQRTWDELLWLFDLIRSVWQSIEAGAYPLNPSSWLCSPRFCSYWSKCRGRGL